MQPIYLDHNATTPILPAVLAAMNDCWASFRGNPSSQHAFGRQARSAWQATIEQMGSLLGAELAGPAADQVIFTSGGSESNNLALLTHAQERPGHALVSGMEHPSVSRCFDRLKGLGWQVDLLPVTPSGTVTADMVAQQIRPETRLAAVMLANHETGALNPIAEIASICQKQGIALHVDAVQAVGKLPVQFGGLGATTLAAAGHKFGGPIGSGLLLVRGGHRLFPIFAGGEQQHGLRPGTQCLPLAVGFCHALRIAQAELPARAARLQSLRDHLQSMLAGGFAGLVVHAAASQRAPQTLCVSFPGINRQTMLMALDMAGVACSTGSACSSGSSEPSPTLQAMGLPESLVDSALRFSVGISQEQAEIETAGQRILEVAHRLLRFGHHQARA